MRGLFILLLLLPSLAHAGSRDLLFYQGLLFDQEKKPVNGAVEMTFRLYGVSSGGDPLWEETESVPVENGLYSVNLGDGQPFPTGLFDRESLYLGLQVGGDIEMTPRLVLSSVPFAQQCEVAITAQSLLDNIVTSAAIALGAVTSSKIAIGAVGPAELASSGVTQGTYTLTTMTVDADGRVTSAAHGSLPAGLGDITSVLTGTGLTGGALTGDVTIRIASGGVTSTEIADGTITNTDISATAAIVDSKLATISSAGKVADSALSSSVALLGQTIESAEVTDGTLLNADINTSAAIVGTKISPNFGSQSVTTSGSISTTGSGDITAAGDLAAAGGFKMMIGPFTRVNVAASEDVSWEMATGGSAVDEIRMPWAGSVMGVSVRCAPGGGVTAGTLTVEPTIDGTETNLEATLTSASGNNKHASATQAKDVDSFTAGQPVGCKGTSASLSPTTLDCVCLVFVEL